MKRSVAIGAAAAVLLAIGGAVALTVGLSEEDGPAERVFAMDIVPMQVDGACVYLDDKGANAFPGKFDSATEFLASSGLAVVKQGEKFGVIDRTGAYTAKPQFEALRLADGDRLFYAAVDGKWGLIDQTGKFLVNPQFENVGLFDKEGLAAALKDSRAGMIDKTGKWVIQPQFDEIRASFPEHYVYAELPAYFFGDLAAARLNGKWGFIDRKGKWRINPQFSSVGRFDEKGLATATNDEFLSGYIGKDGKWAIEPQFEGAYDFDGAPLAAIMNEAEEWGYIDRDGKFAIVPRFVFGEDFSEGSGKWLAPVSDESDYGYIDEKGDWAINPQFADALPFDRNRRAVVKFGDQFGLIGTDGTFVVNPAYARLKLIKGTKFYFFQSPAGTQDPKAVRFGEIDADGKVRVEWTGIPCFS